MNEQLTRFDPPEKPAIPMAAGEAAITRAAKEVEAAMVIAKRFPRDETARFQAIIKSCSRKTLAEVACYAYPRGGTTVTGPSIRLAECLAQNWGNIDFGVVELSQGADESQVMAYAWDLETNTRQCKIFSVPHIRRKGQQNIVLDDPRDIYELVANQGARRLRACILGVIPGDIVDAAVEACEKTLKTDKEPLADRIRKMVVAFSELGVSQVMLEVRLGHNATAINETELVQLRKIYTSLKDGAAKREDYFKLDAKTERKEKREDDSNPELQPVPPVTTAVIPPAPSQEDPFAAKPAAPRQTVQQELAAFVEGLGFRFDQFARLAEQEGWIKDCTSLSNWDELDGRSVGRWLRAKTGLEAALRKAYPAMEEAK